MNAFCPSQDGKSRTSHGPCNMAPPKTFLSALVAGSSRLVFLFNFFVCLLSRAPAPPRLLVRANEKGCLKVETAFFCSQLFGIKGSPAGDFPVRISV